MKTIFLNVETYNEDGDTLPITIQVNAIRTVSPLKIGCRISFLDGSWYRLTCTRNDFLARLKELECEVADCVPGEDAEKFKKPKIKKPDRGDL